MVVVIVIIVVVVVVVVLLLLLGPRPVRDAAFLCTSYTHFSLG